jgi:hypothetical protein
MTQSVPVQHISSFDLDLLEMGALDEAKKRALDEHLRACDACRQDHESLKKFRAEFSGNVMPRTISSVRERAASPEKRSLARPAVLAPLFASAAALMVWVAAGGGPSLRAGGDDAVRPKGEAALQLVARHEGRVTTLDPAHRSVAAADEIRFVVTPTDTSHPYLFVVSVDGGGRANFYFPFDGAESARVDRVGRWEIPGSIVLDDTAGPERVFALFSREPLDKATVARALAQVGQQGWDAIRATERLGLADVEESSFVIEKSTPSRR